MLNYFIKNKHGVISVFWAIILIATMSFSSLLVEIGRKRSIDALFQEVVEKSAFSTLSQYDRKLFKRFALLAMDQQLSDSEKTEIYTNYIKSNLNYELADNSIAPLAMDKLVTVEGGTIEGIYDLADIDVLRSQIEEASKYRSPYSIVENTLNLESSINDFVKEVEKTIPVLSYLKSATEIGKDLVNLIEKAVAIDTETDNLDEAKSNYSEGVKTYNEAVDTYENAIAGLDSEAEDYDIQLATIKSTMSSAGNTFRKQIKDLMDGITSYRTAVNDFEEAFNEYVSDGFSSTLRIITEEERKEVAAANAQNNIGVTGYSQWSQMERDEYDKVLETIYNADQSEQAGDLFKDIKNGLKSIKEAPYEKYQKNLGTQRDSIEGDDWPTVSEIKEEKASIWDYLDIGVIQMAITFLTVVEKLVKFFEELITAFKSLSDLMKSFDILNSISKFDIRYNDGISSVESILPSNNQGQSKTYQNTMDNDKSLVIDQLNETNDVAQKVGYKTDVVSPKPNTKNNELRAATSQLMDKYNNFYISQTKFNDACNNWQMISVIINLVSLIANTIFLLVAVIQYVSKIQSFGNILDMIYSSAIVADYSVRMFPNRSTNIYSDSNLLGDEWSKYSDYWSALDMNTVNDDNFSLARSEYIYGGNVLEKENQELSYNAIFAVRALINVVPILAGREPMNMIKTVLKVPYVGWLLAIILFVTMIFLEAKIDLVLMIGGKFKILMIKFNAWLFSVDGAKKLAEHLVDMVNNSATKEQMESFMDSYIEERETAEAIIAQNNHEPPRLSGDVGEIEKKGYLKQHGASLESKIGCWGYADYLMLMIMFQPENITLERIADLIQLEMNAWAKKEGYSGYKLSNANTYIRVTAKGTYKPILPILTIPGQQDIIINELYYAGY